MSILKNIEFKSLQLALTSRALELQRGRVREAQAREREIATARDAIRNELDDLIDQLVQSKM